MAWADDLRIEIEEMFAGIERSPIACGAAWGLGITMRRPAYEPTGPRTILKKHGPDGNPVPFMTPEERAAAERRRRREKDARIARRRMHTRSEQVNAMGRAHALFPSLSAAVIELVVTGGLRGNPARVPLVLSEADPEDLRRCREWAATIAWSEEAKKERRARELDRARDRAATAAKKAAKKAAHP